VRLRRAGSAWKKTRRIRPPPKRRTATSGRPLRPAIRDQHCVVPEKPLEISDVAGARRLEEGEQQSATLREELSMLKSPMELEELARRVVGGDREAVHGLVRGVAADSARPLHGPAAQGSGASGCNPPLRSCESVTPPVSFQFSRAATPQTMTGPALPNGAPFGPVMYPSLASFKMRNSSVRRPR